MSRSQIRRAYARSGVEDGRTVYVTGNFGRPGLFGASKTDVLAMHLEALLDLIGPSGTLCVPTASLSLLRSKVVFDPRETPSEMGPFTELVRRSPGSMRQSHPFVSQTALGNQASFITGGKTSHVFGPDSPMDRLTRLEARFISVGMPAKQSMSIVHHVEFLANVPYRYVKTFQHQFQSTPTSVECKTVFLHVVYRDKRILREGNNRIAEALSSLGYIRNRDLGSSFIDSYEFTDFVQTVLPMMMEDPYIWLQHPVLDPHDSDEVNF